MRFRLAARLAAMIVIVMMAVALVVVVLVRWPPVGRAGLVTASEAATGASCIAIACHAANDLSNAAD